MDRIEAKRELSRLIHSYVIDIEKRDELLEIVKEKDFPPVKGIINAIGETYFSERDSKIIDELFFYYG